MIFFFFVRKEPCFSILNIEYISLGTKKKKFDVWASTFFTRTNRVVHWLKPQSKKHEAVRKLEIEHTQGRGPAAHAKEEPDKD